MNLHMVKPLSHQDVFDIYLKTIQLDFEHNKENYSKFIKDERSVFRKTESAFEMRNIEAQKQDQLTSMLSYKVPVGMLLSAQGAGNSLGSSLSPL